MGGNTLKVLVVDDMNLNRQILKRILEDDYEIIEACNGLEAIKILERHKNEISIVLLDVVMPIMDGFGVLEFMNKNSLIKNIPVIMISAENANEFIIKGYELGVVDYINRNYDTTIIKRRIRNTIMLYAKQKELKVIIKEQVEEKEKKNALMVDILSNIVEFRNGESGLHVRRIRVITSIILKWLAKEYKEYSYFNYSVISEISNAAALHDVGKIIIPEEIINKPGKLTKEEFEIMKTHTTKGSDMILSSYNHKNDTLINYAYSICRWHHERWDGKGYPDGLKGDEIPICAQVVSLADVYDALTSERVYKAAYSHKKSVEMIVDGQCGDFNPKLLCCLIKHESELESQIKIHDNDNLLDIDKITHDIILKKAKSNDNNTKEVDFATKKYNFMLNFSDEVIFNYNSEDDIFEISKKGYENFNIEPKIINAKKNFKKFSGMISFEQFALIYEKITKATAANPYIKTNCLIRYAGKEIECKVIIQTIWKVQNFLGFVGKLQKI